MRELCAALVRVHGRRREEDDLRLGGVAVGGGGGDELDHGGEVGGEEREGHVLEGTGEAGVVCAEPDEEEADGWEAGTGGVRGDALCRCDL